MVNYNYKKRTQPETRLHLGELPTKDDTKQRFAKIKEQQKQLKDISRDVKLQTGDEFFFNMQNCYKKNSDVYRKTNIDVDLVKKQLQLCDFEIQKAKKRVVIHKRNNNHLRFESDSDVNEFEFRENDDDRKYLDELQRHREDLKNLLYKAKNETSKRK